LPRVDKSIKMFNEAAGTEDPIGTTSKNKFVPGRSSVSTTAALHLELERAASIEEQITDAWTIGWEVFIGNRESPTTKDKLSGRGGMMIEVDACLIEPETTAIILRGTCELTFSLQGKEKFRRELDTKTTGRGIALNTSDISIVSRDLGKFETRIWTLLLPAKHSLTTGLLRVTAGKISRIKLSSRTLGVAERMDKDMEPAGNGVIKRISNTVEKLPTFDALRIENDGLLTEYWALLESCEKLYEVTVMVLPPEDETEEGVTAGGGATILKILTGKETFLALTKMVSPSAESTSDASPILPPTMTDIRQERNVQPSWILGKAFEPKSEPIRATTVSVEAKKLEKVKKISLPVILPPFWTVIKWTKVGGSDCKDGALEGTICIQFTFGLVPQSTMREFTIKLQASTLTKSETRTVKSATAAELGRVVKKSLGYGIDKVLNWLP
jgi:hypothetical protein